MKKGQRSWGRVLAPNLGNKANMEKHKIFYFRASVTLKAVSLQSNGMLMMCKIQQAMKDDAIWTTRIHPAVHPGNREHVRHFLQYFQPAYRDLGWKNRNLGNRASPPSHMNTYQGFRGKARSRKPGQPGQPGSYEEAPRPTVVFYRSPALHAFAA